MQECLKKKKKEQPKWTSHLSEEFISDQGKKQKQEYEYPPFKELAMEKFITGVYTHPNPYYSHSF